MLLEQSYFILGVAILIGRISLERKRIEGVLWVLLMINVVVSIVPVDELGPILTSLLARSITLLGGPLLFRERFHLKSFVVGPVSC